MSDGNPWCSCAGCNGPIIDAAIADRDRYRAECDRLVKESVAFQRTLIWCSDEPDEPCFLCPSKVAHTHSRESIDDYASRLRKDRDRYRALLKRLVGESAMLAVGYCGFCGNRIGVYGGGHAPDCAYAAALAALSAPTGGGL